MRGGTNEWAPFNPCSLAGALKRGIVLTAALLLASPGLSDSGEDVVHAIDFTEPANGDATTWLREQGFDLRMNAQALSPRFTDRGLVLSIGYETTGLFAEQLHLAEAERVRVTWGVDRYPEGANWEDGTYRVPIAIMVSFGQKEVSSGSLLVPDMPYFIALFLSKNAEPRKGYMANYYHKGGRYFCDPCSPPTGEPVTTTFDLAETFRRTFDIQEVPPISGFSFQMNTEDTKGGAQAFIKRVEFLEQ